MAVVKPDGTDAIPEAPGALEALFLELESRLLAYALRIVKNDETAQDLVQEAFLRLHAQTDPVLEPRRWLYRTVHNLALNHLRQRGRIVPLQPAAPGATEHDPIDPHPLPDEQVARWETVELVRLGLEALDNRSRDLVRFKFHENLSYREISDRTGLSVGNVGYLLHHALKHLASELTRGGMIP
jgi:RNA polymerase sigma-70 factor (ECF subfamily)